MGKKTDEDGLACCLGCHFDYEEETAFPYLPPMLVVRLREDHRRLREQNFPREKVTAHAKDEMRTFRRFVPADIVARIEAEHAKHARGEI